MKKNFIFILFFILVFNTFIFADEINIIPIKHATLLIKTEAVTIYVDPVEDISAYKQYPKPDIVLITHTHKDHLNKDIVNLLYKENIMLIEPEAVFDEVKNGEVLKNGDSLNFKNINIEAVPMYNITKERLNFHEKGIGNGYVLTIGNKRIYISGDTEDTVEVRNLKNIDYAVLCMNLPYTMSIEQAASAVLAFKPKVVIPYHYRGPDGFSDLQKFKKLVSEDKNIEVHLLDWYPK